MLQLLSFQSCRNRLRQKFHICHHRIWLFFIIILCEWHKINMFRIHQHPDIFKTGSQCIVGGYGNYQWFAIAHMRFGSHQNRSIGDCIRQLRRRISCTRCNHHHIQISLRSDRFCLLKCADSRVPRYVTDFFHKLFCRSKPRIAVLRLIRKDGNHMCSHLRQSLNLFPGFCECTERTGNPIPYIAI